MIGLSVLAKPDGGFIRRNFGKPQVIFGYAPDLSKDKMGRVFSLRPLICNLIASIKSLPSMAIAARCRSYESSARRGERYLAALT
jgi:hypothetical protein